MPPAAQVELAALEAELRRAYGLGGRPRSGCTPAERTRLSVTMNVTAALGKTGEHALALAAHLRVTVHTGRYCSCSPEPATADARQLTP